MGMIIKNSNKANCLLELLFTCLMLLMITHNAHALTAKQASALSMGETDQRLEVLQQVIKEPDEKTIQFLQALSDDSVKISESRVFIIKNNQAIDPINGESMSIPAQAQDVVSNNRMRGELDSALSALRLFSLNPKERLAAV